MDIHSDESRSVLALLSPRCCSTLSLMQKQEVWGKRYCLEKQRDNMKREGTGDRNCRRKPLKLATKNQLTELPLLSPVHRERGKLECILFSSSMVSSPKSLSKGLKLFDSLYGTPSTLPLRRLNPHTCRLPTGLWRLSTPSQISVYDREPAVPRGKSARYTSFGDLAEEVSRRLIKELLPF